MQSLCAQWLLVRDLNLKWAQPESPPGIAASVGGSTVTGRATVRVRCEPGLYTQCLSISGAGLGFNRLESEPCENGYLWSVMAVSTLVLDMAKAWGSGSAFLCWFYFLPGMLALVRGWVGLEGLVSLLLSKRAHSDGGLCLGASFAASKHALMAGSNPECACSLEEPSFSPPVSLTGFQLD